MKGAIHWSEIERPFLVAKGLNTNLVHFLLWFHVIISNVQVCFFTCTILHMHGRGAIMVLRAQNLVYEKL